MKSILNAAITVFVFSSGLALAADPPAGGGPRVACKADVEKLCAGVQRGSGRIAGCIKQNEARVSAACKDAMAKAREKKAAPAPLVPQG
jgi:hypothetical protein